MSSSLQSQNNDDYSDFGFEGSTGEAENSYESQYSDMGFEPEKRKAGTLESAWLGLQEGALGALGLAQYGANELVKSNEKAFGLKSTEIPFEKENPLLSHLSKLPKSEGQLARRVRAGAAALPLSALFGIPGIVAGLVGSQAGQTVREVFGKEGEFENFGWGEGSALAADVIAGGGAGVATSIARGGGRAAVSQIPKVFEESRSLLDRAVVKNTVQGETRALENIVNDFSQGQLRGFEEQASRVSPNRYTDLTQSSASGLQRGADDMFRNTQLSIVSPIAATPEQGGRAVQEAANETFQRSVISAEREAYQAAEEAAEGLTGTTPRSIAAAKELRAELSANAPTPETQPVINFLDDFIRDLETTTAETHVPPSTLISESGEPLVAGRTVPSSTQPTVRSANELVQKVQNANQAVNYGSELRLQSHRLIPIIRTFRQEVGQVLSQNPEAARAYQTANTLHGRNAEVWGTRYMRNVRFTENPEKIVGQTKSASNMRNLKQAITDPTIQGVAERLVVEDMTQGGSAKSNRVALNNLRPELSANAQNASEALINVKDPLTTTGGRAAVRNQILKDAAQAVNTGKRPEKILDLMQTVKGYEIVRESLSHSPQGRQLFQSFQRLFIEDVFSSALDEFGRLDFRKARNIFKNQDVRNVVRQISPEIEGRFMQLEQFANNFDRNISLYKSPEAKSLFRKMVAKSKSAGLIGLMMHAMHVPVEVIAGLGLGSAVLGASKLGYTAIVNKLLSNPNAVRALESISRANTTQELARQVPRLIAEIDKESETE